MKAIKIILGITIAAVVAFSLFSWMEKHDAALEKAYDAYDTCVWQTYGISAASYYQVHQAAAPCE